MPPQSFSLLFLPFCLGSFYTEEPPVKLLSVHSIATRFPAAASEYRDSVENGHVSFLPPPFSCMMTIAVHTACTG